MKKEDVAHVLNEIADILEILGENPFKFRAYRAAARTVESYAMDFERLVNEQRLSELKGFGEGLTKKVTQFVTHGRMTCHDELRARVPDGLLDMLKIQGLGPKKVKGIYEALRIETLSGLQEACEAGRVAELPGFGKKSQENILRGIAFIREHAGRSRWSSANLAAAPILEALRGLPETIRADIAGSLRRKKEIVKDIDLLAASGTPEKVMDAFVGADSVERIFGKGPTKSTVLLPGGLHCDLRVVREDEYPYALLHFTGSREHNTALRGRAKTMGLKLNEYGLFRGDERLSAETEADVYRALGLACIPPELREDLGEVGAAEKGEIPKLIEPEDVRGTLHAHTFYSDGHATVEEMAKAAGEMGFEYLGISDHSQTAFYAGGLSIDDVKRQIEEIDRVNEAAGNEKGKGRQALLFKGIESDILPNGDLDYPEEVLALFDFVIASVHSHFGMPEDRMTDRVLKAVRNPFTTILGHPTGRLLLIRGPYALNLDRVIEAAGESGTMIEINSNPYRLDLDWRWCRKAKDSGVLLCLSPDAHKPEGLDDTWNGVGVARKGWLGPKDVLNAYGPEDALRLLRRKRG